jgi:hypothetical protein
MATLLAAPFVAAQGGPTVDWWVLAGGGAPSSAEAVILDDTFGQPVIGPAAVGNVELNAGYWVGCAAAPAVAPALAAAIEGADVVLTWDGHLANVRFEVWAAEDPYFDPADPGGITPVVTTDTTWRDEARRATRPITTTWCAG